MAGNVAHGQGAGDPERFTHLAFVWTGGVLNATPTDAWRGLQIRPLPPDACPLGNEGRGCNWMRRRVFRVHGHRARRAARLQECALSGDPVRRRGLHGRRGHADPGSFEDRFRPDGQDAWTAAAVCRVSEACSGGQVRSGAQASGGPPRPGLDVLKEMGVKVDTHWAWQPEMRPATGSRCFWTTGSSFRASSSRSQSGRSEASPTCVHGLPGHFVDLGLIERYGDEWQTLPVSTLLWQYPTRRRTTIFSTVASRRERTPTISPPVCRGAWTRSASTFLFR